MKLFFHRLPKMFKWVNKIEKPEYQKLYSLINKASDLYQDIELEGETIIKGGAPQDCQERWEMIKNYIRPQSVIINIGSDLGYFTCKIAEKFPNVLVLSFESSDKAEIQREILKVKKLYNVVLLNHKLWTDDLHYWTKCVEGIDMFLMLCVFHHYPPEESLKALDSISKMSPELITSIPIRYPIQGTEFPDRINDPRVQEQYSNFVKEIKKRYGIVEIMGESDLGPAEKRPIYHARNSEIIRDKIATTFTRKLDNPKRQEVCRLEYNEPNWILKRKMETFSKTYDREIEKWISGVSSQNLLHFNPIWPPIEWWQKQMEKGYKKLIDAGKNVTDIGPQNVVFTAKGFKIVDWSHSDPHYNKDFALREIEKAKKLYIEFKEKL